MPVLKRSSPPTPEDDGVEGCDDADRLAGNVVLFLLWIGAMFPPLALAFTILVLVWILRQERPLR